MYFKIVLMLQCLYVITTDCLDNFEYCLISTLSGTSTALPCNLTTAIPSDQVTLVLWFKGDDTKPVYTLDARGPVLEAPHHWSNDDIFQGRAFFDISSCPSQLLLDDVTPEDEATYKCRVDYKIQPTVVRIAKLSVIVQPMKPKIFNAFGKDLLTKIGPYKVGESVSIKCEVKGGRPRPNVTWLKNDMIVDENFELSSETTSTNILTIPSIKRIDQGSIFTCEAKNNNSTLPLTTSVIMDMTFGPESVTISGASKPFVAGKKYTIKCKAVGSKPDPDISWKIGGMEVDVKHTRLKTSQNELVTTSILGLISKPQYNGQNLSCHAKTPTLENSEIQTSQVLTIHHISKAYLSLGKPFEISQVKVGGDVFLDCDADAYPLPHKIIWTKDGKHLELSQSEEILLSNHSLIFHRLSSSSFGYYTCEAFNYLGSVKSNYFYLQTRDIPRCIPNQTSSYSVPLLTTAEVKCEVEDDGEDPITFNWVFISKFETLDIMQSEVRTNGPMSIVSYKPQTHMDYGNLLCWAQNSVGQQSEACTFHVHPVDKALSLKECHIHERKPTYLSVNCIMDGKMENKIIFIIEVRHKKTWDLVANLTSVVPSFTINKLDPGQEYSLSVYSVTTAGAGEKLILIGKTLTEKFDKKTVQIIDEYEKADDSDASPIWWGLFGASGVLIILIIGSFIIFCVKCFKSLTKRKTRTQAMLSEYPGIVIEPPNYLLSDLERRSQGSFSHQCPSNGSYKIIDPYMEYSGHRHNCRYSITSNASSYIPRSSSQCSSQKSSLGVECNQYHPDSISEYHENISFTSLHPHVNPERFQYLELGNSQSGHPESTERVSRKRKRKKKYKSSRRNEQSIQTALPKLPILRNTSVLSSEVSSIDTLDDVPSEWESDKHNQD